MDAVQVALLTLAALVAGMLSVVMVQVWITLRQLQKELRDTQAKVDPMIDEMRTVLGQVRSATQIASAVSMAVTAGIHAWQQSKGDTGHDG